MKRTNTKQEILNAALDLFSTQGYEATSILQIAEKVGIKKASMYSHFINKQDILNSLIEEVLEQYEKNSIFAKNNWVNLDNKFNENDKVADALIEMILKQVKYIVHDPVISKTRKMLTIEQFQNEQMRKLQTKQNYTDVMDYFKKVVCHLVNINKIIKDDIEMMAIQLCLPISVWINLCDRELEKEEEILNLIERHIKHFFKIYGRNEH